MVAGTRRVSASYVSKKPRTVRPVAQDRDPPIFQHLIAADAALKQSGVMRLVRTAPGQVRDDIATQQITMGQLPTEIQAAYQGFEGSVADLHIEHEIAGPVYVATLTTGTRERWSLSHLRGWELHRSIR